MYCIEVKELRAFLQTQNLSEIAFDFETTDLDFYKLEPEGISLYNGKQSLYIDFTQTQELNQIIQELKRLFERRNTTFIAHYIVFDMLVLYKLGIKIKSENIFCTMMAAFLLNENKPVGLKDIVEQLLGRQVTRYEEVQYLRRNDPKFVKYAEDDAINCYDLYKLFKPELTKQGLDKLFYQIEMPFQFVVMDMKINGIMANLDKIEHIDQLCRDKLLDLESQLYEQCGIPYSIDTDLLGNKLINGPINFGSSQDLIFIIEKKLGIKLTEKTKPSKTYPDGQKSTGSKVLEKIKHRHEFIKTLLKWKKLNKLYNSFVKPFEAHVDPDGRIRCDFNTAVAVTGRLTSSDPNLQQLPRDSSEFGFNFRDLFIAPVNKSLIVADFGGQELRLLADLSQDPKLLKAFKENMDVHLMLARKMLNLHIKEEFIYECHPQYEETKKKFKDERYKAKNGVNFPIIYGTTAHGISKNLNVSKRKAQYFIDSFFDLFVGAARAMQKCNRFLYRNKYVYNKTGRKRRFLYIDDHAKRQAFNFLIQGTAADMVKASMVLIRKICLKHPEWEMKIVLTVHDEVVVEILDEFIEIGKKAIEWAMTTAYKISVPLVVEISSAKSYGEAK